MTELCFLLLHNGSPETPRLTSLINSKSNLYPKHFWLSARLTRDAGSSNVSFTDTSSISPVLCRCVYVYTSVYTCICVYIPVHMYIKSKKLL